MRESQIGPDNYRTEFTGLPSITDRKGLIPPNVLFCYANVLSGRGTKADPHVVQGDLHSYHESTSEDEWIENREYYRKPNDPPGTAIPHDCTELQFPLIGPPTPR